MSASQAGVPTLHVNPRIARFSQDEKDRHVDVAVQKSRGGSPLLQGARSPGRWDPACSCGWRNSSNEGRRDAEQAWREHRACAVFEERRLRAGDPIFRVVVAYDEERGGQAIREWRGFETANDARHRAAQDASKYQVARTERSFDGETWEAMGR